MSISDIDSWWTSYWHAFGQLGICLACVALKDLLNKDFLNTRGIATCIFRHCRDVAPIPFPFLWFVVRRKVVARLRRPKQAKNCSLSLLVSESRVSYTFVGDKASIDENCRAILSNKRRYDMYSVYSFSYAGTHEHGMGMVPFAAKHHLSKGKFGNDG